MSPAVRVTLTRKEPIPASIVRDVTRYEDTATSKGRQLTVFLGETSEVIARLHDLEEGWFPVVDGSAVKGSWDVVVESLG